MRRIIKNQSYRKISSDPRIPKGPALDVSLTDRTNQAEVPVFALIDTGADITCIKWTKILELESQLGGLLPMERIQDIETGSEVFTYAACLVIGGKKLIPEFGIYCPDDDLFDLTEASIGRDIQKELVITLDGPNEVFHIDVP